MNYLFIGSKIQRLCPIMGLNMGARYGNGGTVNYPPHRLWISSGFGAVGPSCMSVQVGPSPGVKWGWNSLQLLLPSWGYPGGYLHKEVTFEVTLNHTVSLSEDEVWVKGSLFDTNHVCHWMLHPHWLCTSWLSFPKWGAIHTDLHFRGFCCLG